MTQDRSRRRGRALAIAAAAACLLAGVASPAGAAWRQEIDGPGGGADRGNAVAIDGAGNVFAAGALDYGDDGTSFTVIKLDAASGAEIWRRDYLTSASMNQGVLALALDASGNVIAAGELDLDFTVIKLSGADGSEIWSYQIDGTSGFETPEEARSLAVDAGGDVLAAGFVNNAATGRDFTVVKLSGGGGAELWRTEIDGGDGSSDRAAAVAVDAGGNAFAAGRLDTLADAYDFTVIKLAAATGSELWRYRLDGTDSSDDDALDVAVDASGNVVAAGFVDNAATEEDFAVIKLDGASGAELWRQEVEGQGTGWATEERATAVTIDSAGDVIATGGLEFILKATDMVVIKFAGSDGSQIWNRQFDGEMLAAQDFGLGVAVDGADDVVIAARIENGPRPDFDFSVLKYSGASGDLVWRQHADGTNNISVGVEEARAIAVDAAGDVVAIGFIDNDVEGKIGHDLAVLQLDGETGIIGPVPGNRLQMTDMEGSEERRQIKVGLDDWTIVVPLPGAPGDPRTDGAELRILNPVTLEIATFSLPAGPLWRESQTSLGFHGYVYRDKEATGACTSVQVVPRESIHAVCTGKSGAIPFSLDEPTQGQLIATFQFGTGPLQCTTFGGKISRDIGTTGPGTKGAFKAVRAPVALGAACP